MISKVLAISLYMSGLFDSKLILKKVVWRKKQSKGGGAFICGDYMYNRICIPWRREKLSTGLGLRV